MALEASAGLWSAISGEPGGRDEALPGRLEVDRGC